MKLAELRIYFLRFKKEPNRFMVDLIFPRISVPSIKTRISLIYADVFDVVNRHLYNWILIQTH